MTVADFADLLCDATEADLAPPYKVLVGPVALAGLREDVAEILRVRGWDAHATAMLAINPSDPAGYAGRLFGAPVWEVADMGDQAEVVTDS